ncbi:hypothetical protein ACQ86G_27960 [Roseateles chitinivorans]|uniref:hypothetical protein n=1 Tax=Roseateles chitinivorans TaxID=2917965 RepID=UPI003D66E47A
MQRRSFLLASAATLTAGCASGERSYVETIRSVAIRPEWHQLVVFGERYDYTLSLPPAMAALLQGPARAHLQGSFENARLTRLNQLRVIVTLAVPEEFAGDLPVTIVPGLPAVKPVDGVRIVFRAGLDLERFARGTTQQKSAGSQPTNAKYEVAVTGYAPSPTQTVGNVVSVITLPLKLLTGGFIRGGG